MKRLNSRGKREGEASDLGDRPWGRARTGVRVKETRVRICGALVYWEGSVVCDDGLAGAAWLMS